MADNNHTRNWIIVSVLILISLGATTLILQPDSFEKQFFTLCPPLGLIL